MGKPSNISRRDFLRYSFLAGLALPFAPHALGAAVMDSGARKTASKTPFGKKVALGDQPVYLFSKPIDHFSHEQLVGITKAGGYDGLDVTIRAKNSHIDPKQVRTQLPTLVRIAQAQGLHVPMATTDIWKPDARAEELIRTMADNGISYYRLDKREYDKTIPIERNLELFRAEASGLCELNAKYGITAGIQNHCQMLFNSAVWDGWSVYKDLDPNLLGAQYDIRHAVAESMLSWELPIRAISGHIGSLCIKDLTWAKSSRGSYRPVTVPLGEGIVEFDKFFALLRELDVSVPLSMHIEFPVLTPEQKSLPASEQIGVISDVIHKDRETLKNLLSDNT